MWAVYFLGGLLSGCYDVQALVEARHDSENCVQFVEVDLGNFRVSLPQPSATTETAEIHFRAFGRVSSDDVEVVREMLNHHRPKLEHRILLAIRRLDSTEFEDPKLQTLRKVLADAVNQPLANSPIESVGFYSFGFSNYH